MRDVWINNWVITIIIKLKTLKATLKRPLLFKRLSAAEIRTSVSAASADFTQLYEEDIESAVMTCGPQMSLKPIRLVVKVSLKSCPGDSGTEPVHIPAQSPPPDPESN